MARTTKSPETSKALMNVKQVLTDAAKETAVEKPSGGTKISTKGGKLTYNGAQFPDNQADVIVLEFAAKNKYYASAYNEDEVVPPDCFALELAVGKDFEDKLVPHENVVEPVHAKCMGCPFNEFKSAANGRGKACGNRRELAVIPADVLEANDVAKAILESEIATFSVSPSNINAWKAYTSGLARADLPLWGVTTRISLPSVFDQAFAVVDGGQIEPHLTKEVYDAILAKKKEARELLLVPYEPLTEEQKEAAKAPKGRGAAPSGRSARFTAPPAKTAPAKRR